MGRMDSAWSSLTQWWINKSKKRRRIFNLNIFHLKPSHAHLAALLIASSPGRWPSPDASLKDISPYVCVCVHPWRQISWSVTCVCFARHVQLQCDGCGLKEPHRKYLHGWCHLVRPLQPMKMHARALRKRQLLKFHPTLPSAQSGWAVFSERHPGYQGSTEG